MIRRLTALMLAAVLALTLASCATVPVDEFTRDDSQTVLSSSTEHTSDITNEKTQTQTQSATDEETTEAPPLSVELLSGGKWRDPNDSGKYVSTILFNASGTFVMTVMKSAEGAYNCMGTYSIVDDVVQCIVTERDSAIGPDEFSLEYKDASLVYRGDATGTVSDGDAFVR